MSLITNDEVLSVNQNSYNNHEVYNDDGIIVWSANIPGSENIYAAVFNTNDNNKSQINLVWKRLGLKNQEYKVRDLWNKNDLGKFKNSISLSIPKHGAKLLKIS